MPKPPCSRCRRPKFDIWFDIRDLDPTSCISDAIQPSKLIKYYFLKISLETTSGLPEFPSPLT